MFQVLVVDDESPILRNVCKMIENENSMFDPKYRARNGEEAIEILEQHKEIDCMFLDINMPIMNGLKVLSELKNRGISIKVVILSGFQEFHYVREALRNGAVDYLTKPLKKNELNNVLKHVEELILLENYQIKSPYTQNEEDMKEYGDYEMASIIFGGLVPLEEATNREWIEEADNILKYYLQDKYVEDEYWVINRSYNERVIMLKNNKVKNHIVWKNVDEIFKNSKVAVTMVLYKYPQSHKTIHTTDSKLNTIGRNLMNLKKHIFYYGDGENVVEENVKEIKRIKEKYSYVQPKSQVGKVLKNLVVDSSGNRSVLSELLKTYFLYSLEKAGVVYSYREMESRIEYCVMSAKDLDELCKEIQQLNSEYFGIKVEKEYSKKHLANEIKQYIDTYFETNITNLVLEQYYGFVSSYLRQIFRQEYKMSPMEYLLNVRIEQSKKMLIEHKDWTIKMVASSVGFHDSMYFSKVFKKREHKTPGEFREMGN